MSLKLTLIRGLPGSGKSTLAKTLPAVHLETDMYFINAQGQYQFDARKLPEAHNWCLAQCRYYLQHNKDVVVANTFVKQWEMDHYRKLALEYKAELTILVCTMQFDNIHQVPQSTVAKMKRNWQA
ncbi:ATP-binding protein [Psychromonas sp. MME2]|uniref:ATP-binding protein n=1 Tax=unclassified Psychromonas TaxID=2614957 RepID=UPI00339CB29A